MSIKNFILIQYSKKELDIKVDKKIEDFYLNSQKDFLEKMIFQINYHYPKSTIHILTNEECKIKNVEIHKKEFESNHCCKFLLFSLLKEPAMYLDCDIIMYRKFPEHSLETDFAFKMFNTSRTINLESISNKIKGNLQIYNAGIIWIPSPNKAITQELEQIEKEYFGDKEIFKRSNEWPYNDEYATSLYIKKRNWSFPHDKKIGVFRNAKDKNEQSIHYTGLNQKKFFDKEFKDHYSNLTIKLM